MNNEWRNIPGFDGIYQASVISGEIRSVDRYQEYVGGRGNVYHKRFLHGKTIRPQKQQDGKHFSIGLSYKGKVTVYSIQQLIAITFPDICGVYKKGLECHHIDGDPSNNKPSNILVVTKKEHLKIHSENGAYPNLVRFEKGSVPWNKIS